MSICGKLFLLRKLLREALYEYGCVVRSEKCYEKMNRIAELLGEIMSDLCGE